MTRNTIIRKARPNDARAIAEVHVASWKAAYSWSGTDVHDFGIADKRSNVHW
jgi:hypothetical protein